MQKVFTDQTLFMVTNIRNLLSQAGIESELRNEYAAGGVGELSFVDAWPELWVDFEDVARAKEIIAQSQADSKVGEWRCSCGELNGANFDFCWKCQRERDFT